MKRFPSRSFPAVIRSFRLRAALLLGVAAALTLAPAALAQAANSPAITVTDGAPTSVLNGSEVPVSLTAADPTGEPYGYNLAFRYVLPAGVSYVAGSETTEAGEPQILANAPHSGETTLIWHNVDDLSPASSRTISFKLHYDTSVYDVGDSLHTEVGAYISTNARDEADFNADGTPGASGPGSYTGSATATADTKITAIEVTKSEPHPEGEIPRGVHDHQTIYTLTVTNNHVNPTNEVKLEDFLPAGLEFLGCETTPDHTTNAPTYPGHAEEYAGSGPIKVEPVSECIDPDVVETVEEDPDGTGPLKFGVYTRVVWNDIGSFAANETQKIRYRAAIPERRNTMTWTTSGGEPAKTGAQAANLDNNSGPETQDEEELLNGAIVGGTYKNPSKPGIEVSDEGTLLRTAEDLAIQKTNDKPTLEQGDLTEWTVDLQVSEYRYLDNVVIHDTIPNGLCPLGPENYAHNPIGDDSECAPVAGKDPSEPYTSVTEQPDGTYAVTWDKATFPALAHLLPDATEEMTFWTRTRTNYQHEYQDAGPVLSHDAVTNEIQTEGEAFVRCERSNPDCTTPSPGDKINSDWHDGDKVYDVSTSGKEAAGPVLEKMVAAHYPASGDCSELGPAAYGKTVPTYGPGDYVCWKLQVVFPAKLDTHSLNVYDLLPHGIEYVAGSWQATTANTIPTEAFTSNEGRLGWVIGGGDDVDAGGQIFEVTLKTQVGSPLGHKSGDVEGNLEKFSYENTAGKSFALRDLTDFKLKLPELSLKKGVYDIDGKGNFPADTDNKEVRGDDEVEFRVDVTNDGKADASSSRVWDLLPTGISCADVPAAQISDGGSCVEESGKSRIQWSSLPLAMSATKTLTYVVDIPNGVSSDQNFVNTAGVVEYTYATNGGETYKLVPENTTVKDSGAGTPNTKAAEDASNVFTPASGILKTRTTSVEEGGNAKENQATIGENVEYTVTTTLPHGTTLYNAKVTDPLETSRQSYVEGSLTATLNGVALPTAGVTASISGGTITATFPSTFTVGSTDAVLVLKFKTKVLDVDANTRSTKLANTATLTAEDQLDRPITHSNKVETTIVEPQLSASKTDNVKPGRVKPGQIVKFTVGAADGSATNDSTAHEVTVVDTIPAGTTPVDGEGNALANGAAAGPQGGIWNAPARTITWTTATTPALGAIAPGAKVELTYEARVDEPAVSGTELTNNVVEQTKSLNGSVGGVRTSSSTASTDGGYESKASDTLLLQLAAITKSVTPEKVTIGNEAVWKLHVTVPKDLQTYDTTVVDTVPDGFAVDGYGTINCISGCLGGDPTVETFTPVVKSNGTTEAAWFLGDLAAGGQERVYELELHGHLLDTYRHGGAKVLNGESLVNKASVGSDRTNKVGENPTTIPTSFDDTAGPAEATNKVVEPKLAITKTASAGPKVEPGQPLTYTVKVTNNGTSAAYDAIVEDEPDTELTNVVLVENAGLATQGWTPGNHKIKWTVPGPLAPGESATFTYTAEVVGGGSLHDGELIKNTASIAEYFGVPHTTREAHPTWEYRRYTGPNSTVELNVDLPVLSLNKTTGAPGDPDEANAEIGVPFKWRVEVTNTATKATAFDVAVTDTLPPNWEYKSGSTTFSPGTGIDPTVTDEAAGDKLAWDNVGNLAPGAKVIVEFEAIPLEASATDPGHGAANPHINSAVSTAKDSSGSSGSLDGPYKSNTDTAKAILHIPDLAIEKTPDNGSAIAGTNSSFQIKVTDTGEVAANHVVVDDTLPAGLVYTAGTATASPSTGFSEAGGVNPLEWKIATIAPGASVTITLPVFVEASVPNGELLVNHAKTHADGVPNREDTGSLHVETKSDVSIVKTDEPDPVVAGENLKYTLAVHNAGPSDAQNVTVTDNLPSPDLSFVSVDSGCTHVGNAITCELGTLAAGASKTIHVVTKISPDKEEGETIHNTAKVTTTTTDTNPNNNESSAETHVITRADVSIVKTADKTHYNGGETVTYTLVAHNDGPSTARNVKVKDPLPEEVEFQSVSPGSPTCGQAAALVTCGLGSMEPGESKTITIVTKAKGLPPAPAGEEHHTHKITVEKGEPQISLQADETATQEVSCGNGGEMVDGSARIVAVDQGQSLADVQIVEADSVGLGTYRFVIHNGTQGQAQVKLDYLCLPPQTDQTEGHSHGIIVGNRISTQPSEATELAPGTHEFHLSTPLGYRAVAPGIDVTAGDARIIGSEDDGHGGWNFMVEVTSAGPASFSLSIRPLKEVTGVTDGHAHDLLFEHPAERFIVPPGETRQLRVSCPTGYEGITATYDLPAGVIMLGNDPQPINRDFDVYNTTDHPVEIELDLICLRIETGTEIDALEPVVNTATIETSTPDPNQANDESSAGITISREEGSTEPSSPDGSSSSSTPDPSIHAALAPSSSPSPPVSPDPATPAVRLGAASVTAGGRATAVRVTCSAASACAGTVTLSIPTGSGRSVVVGSAPYRIAAGSSKAIRVRITPHYRRLVRHRRWLNATVQPAGEGAALGRILLGR
ncbi:MAG TPA: isopeptide-forming domain-containing fimbrial protein [Solirubrobacterales bacterium]|nr:isopeptide-forming domain-containing fimbrial protein [Solirubrobacterales bacterium]